MSDVPATGGSYSRDKNGKLRLVEEPTRQEPGGQTSAPPQDEAAAPAPDAQKET